MDEASEETRLGIGPGVKISGDGFRTLKIHFTSEPGRYALIQWKRERVEWSKKFTLAELVAIGKWAKMPTREASEMKGTAP